MAGELAEGFIDQIASVLWRHSLEVELGVGGGGTEVNIRYYDNGSQELEFTVF